MQVSNVIVLTVRGKHINITITVLDFIHNCVFYLEHDVSEPGFCLRLEVEPTQLDPFGAKLCLRTPATTQVGFIKPKQHNSQIRVNISTT
jgi:hypothetical protein